jgi:AcrR family transcriptional regulator
MTHVPRTTRSTVSSSDGAERPRRRTQTERSDAMRRRLIDATLHCLTKDGYAATTVSSIVRRAGVSRGAHLHHFPTKNSLILEATEFLMRRAYRLLGEMLLAIAEDADRVAAVVDGAWKTIYGTRHFGAYFELITAAKHDPDLASAMQALSERTLRTIDGAIDHYFEKRAEGVVTPRDLFVLTHWLLSGIAAGERASVSAADSRHFLEVWASMMATQMRSRRGVRTAPPRPADWSAG